MAAIPVIGRMHTSTTVASRRFRTTPIMPSPSRAEVATKAMKQKSPTERSCASAAQTPAKNPATPPVVRPNHAPRKGRAEPDVVQTKTLLNHPRYYANQNPHAVMPVNRNEIFKLHIFFGHYRLQRGDQHGHFIPNAKYIFVSQMNGDVLMHPRYRHPVLAEGRPVLYAGEAEFKNGDLLWWSNASGNYRPDADHAAQAGLPMGSFHTHEQVRAGVYKQRRTAKNHRLASKSEPSTGQLSRRRQGQSVEAS